MRSSRLGPFAFACAALCAACLLPSLDRLSGAPAGSGDADSPEDGTASPGVSEAGTSQPGVFVLRQLERDGNTTVEPAFAPLAGGAPSSVGCALGDQEAFWFAPCAGAYCPPSPTPRPFTDGPYRAGQMSSATFVGSIADPRFVYERKAVLVGGAVEYALFAATGDSRCGAGMDPIRVSGTLGARSVRHVLPRFSENGRRLAYLDLEGQAPGTALHVARVVATGIDGTASRVLAEPVSPRYIRAMSPVWLTFAGLSWVAWSTGTETALDAPQVSNVEISSDDVLPTTKTLLQDCAGVVQEAAVFARGTQTLVALVVSEGLAGGGRTTALRLGPFTPLPMACDVSRLPPLMEAQPPGTQARDMAISPAGDQLAVVLDWLPLAANAADAGTGDAGARAEAPRRVFLLDPNPTAATRLAPIECSAPGQSVAPFDDVGPQWVSSGRAIVWTRTIRPLGASVVRSADGGLGPVATGIWIADVEGGRCVRQRPLIANQIVGNGTSAVLGPVNASTTAP